LIAAPHRIDSRSLMSGATVDGHVQCDPDQTGTRCSWDLTVTLTGPARFRPAVRPDRATPGTKGLAGLNSRLEVSDKTG
jgi:hypothetical protein